MDPVIINGRIIPDRPVRMGTIPTAAQRSLIRIRALLSLLNQVGQWSIRVSRPRVLRIPQSKGRHQIIYRRDHPRTHIQLIGGAVAIVGSSINTFLATGLR